jgi:hypothetical protein
MPVTEVSGGSDPKIVPAVCDVPATRFQAICGLNPLTGNCSTIPKDPRSFSGLPTSGFPLARNPYCGVSSRFGSHRPVPVCSGASGSPLRRDEESRASPRPTQPRSLIVFRDPMLSFREHRDQWPGRRQGLSNQPDLGSQREKPRGSLGRSLSPLGALSATDQESGPPIRRQSGATEASPSPTPGCPGFGDRKVNRGKNQRQAGSELLFRGLRVVFAPIGSTFVVNSRLSR